MMVSVITKRTGLLLAICSHVEVRAEIYDFVFRIRELVVLRAEVKYSALLFVSGFGHTAEHIVLAALVRGRFAKPCPATVLR